MKRTQAAYPAYLIKERPKYRILSEAASLARLNSRSITHSPHNNIFTYSSLPYSLTHSLTYTHSLTHSLDMTEATKTKKGRRLSGVIKQDAADSGVANLIGTTPSLTHSHTHTHTFTVHSLTHSLTHPLTPPLTHSSTHTSTHSLIHSLTHPLTHSSTHSLIHLHSLTHSLTHPLTPPLTHSLTGANEVAGGSMKAEIAALRAQIEAQVHCTTVPLLLHYCTATLLQC
jgi:hypothetical protein